MPIKIVYHTNLTLNLQQKKRKQTLRKNKTNPRELTPSKPTWMCLIKTHLGKKNPSKEKYRKKKEYIYSYKNYENDSWSFLHMCILIPKSTTKI